MTFQHQECLDKLPKSSKAPYQYPEWLDWQILLAKQSDSFLQAYWTQEWKSLVRLDHVSLQNCDVFDAGRLFRGIS